MILFVFLFLYIGLFEKDRCKALIYAGNIVTFYMYLVTQLLSLFCVYTRPLLIICYILSLAVTVFLYFKMRTVKSAKNTISGRLTWKQALLGVGFIIFVIAVAALSIKTPLYNWDSMTYHMARVHCWFINRSVAHFAAGNIRMLASPPLAEFFVLNSYTMFGACDIFSNLTQTIFYLLSGIVIFGTVGRLVKGRIFSFTAALMFLAEPICFGEALTTQVDVVSTFYLLSFVYLSLDYIDSTKSLHFNREYIVSALIMSLSVAFSYLSKPSVCIGIAVFCVAISIMIIYRRDRIGVVAGFAGISFFTALITIIPEMLRNIATFHALNSKVAGARQLIGTLKPNYIFIEFLKNGVWNMPLPVFNGYNDIIFRGTKKVARFLNVNIDDPAISEDGIYFNLLDGGTWNHDQALNPIIEYAFIAVLLIFIISLIWHLIKQRKKYRICALRAGFLFASVASTFLFLAVVRWEPFVNRYFIGYIALCCISVVVMLDLSFRNRYVKNVFAGILIALCIFQLGILYAKHFSLADSVSTREEGYYIVNLIDKYKPTCDFVIEGRYDNVGISCGGDSYVYPTMHSLYEEGLACHFVLIDNESVVYESYDNNCEAIIILDRSCPDEIEYADKIYSKAYITPGYEDCCVYILR